MKRRTFLSSAGATATLPLTGCMNVSKVAETKLHIFYLCVDDLGTQLGCYGNPFVRSPNFDRFAQDSTLFENAHCQIAICSASRTAILTGLRPEETGLWPLEHDWKARLPDIVSLPEHLQSQGYRTVSIGKIWDERSGPGTQLGWTEKTEVWGSTDSRAALDALDRNLATGEPLAFFFGSKSPHCPWEPNDAALEKYDGVDIVPEGPGRFLPWDYQQSCYGAGTQDLSDAQASDMTWRYYGAVTELDALMGEIIDAIKSRGLYDNSIIVLWSGDHGFHLGQNDHWGKWTNYTASTRIPLMIRAPGMKSGQRCKSVVESVDMYPTLLELAGLNAPAHKFQGKSFAGLLGAPNTSYKDYAFSVWGFNTDKLPQDLDRSVKTSRYNYIRWADRPNSLFQDDRAPAGPMLFDIIEDPLETQNLIDARPDVAEKLEAALNLGWRGQH